ncbi:MAG: hypothetical protein ABH815_04065 [Candidatus Omnitrophota bacterium]
MKIVLCIFLSLISILIAFTNPAIAVEIKDRNEYLIDTRGDDGDIVLNRFSINNRLRSFRLEITAFGEAQWNMEISDWEKITMGIEIGKYFRNWLYIGQSLQFISGEMLDYMAFETSYNSVDSTTKIAIDFPVAKDLFLHLFEEYSANLEEGMGEYCETGIEFNYKLNNSYLLGFGWRHTDRIHNLDTDYVSTSLTLNF